MRNRLRPFVPDRSLRLVVWRAQDVGVDVDDMHAEYGFQRGSKQHNFFDARTPTRVVALLHDATHPAPRHVAHPAVVARAFGVLRRARGEHRLELWHVSVRAAHPLNDSAGGTRWGVFGVARDDSGARVRWFSDDGARVTRRNAARVVRGTPNPYALECLVRVAERFACTAVAQNPEMPCAQLFHAQYCHRTHPATQLLYRALGFVQPVDLEHYAWDARLHPPLGAMHARALDRMARGLPVVE